MSDIKKVIIGLECLAEKREPTANPCNGCGYANRPNFAICVKDVAADALELLKEQEPVYVYEAKISKCTCGNIVNRYYHPKFCGCCGKELMWY